jgi:hypothetical protein
MPPCRKRRHHNATWRRSKATSTAMSLFCQPWEASRIMCARCPSLPSMRRRFDRTRNSRSVAASRSTFSATASLHPPGRLEYAGTVSSMTSIALQKSRCSGAEPLQLAAVGKRLDDRTPSSDSARSSQLPCCAIRSARPAAWLRGPGSDRRPAFLRSRTDLDFQAWWGIIEGWELVGFEQAPS